MTGFCILEESANEVSRVNAPIQARIDEVMSRIDGGLADKTATLVKIWTGREIQFWAIYLIVFVLEFLGFIAKMAQPKDQVDVDAVRQKMAFTHDMAKASRAVPVVDHDDSASDSSRPPES